MKKHRLIREEVCDEAIQGPCRWLLDCFGRWSALAMTIFFSRGAERRSNPSNAAAVTNFM
jgi:hypothetical protein